MFENPSHFIESFECYNLHFTVGHATQLFVLILTLFRFLNLFSSVINSLLTPLEFRFVASQKNSTNLVSNMLNPEFINKCYFGHTYGDNPEDCLIILN